MSGILLVYFGKCYGVEQICGYSAYLRELLAQQQCFLWLHSSHLYPHLRSFPRPILYTEVIPQFYGDCSTVHVWVEGGEGVGVAAQSP